MTATLWTLSLAMMFMGAGKGEKQMVVEYIRYTVPAERAAGFISAYSQAGEVLRHSSHCHRFEISRGVEEPQNFTVRIEWDSVKGHEEGFRSSPEFQSFFGLVRPYFNDILEMKHYQVVRAGVGTAQP